MKEPDVVFICITPVRDEAWVLPSFLEINSRWADHIIILDQCSEDETPDIAKRHPKVTYLRNDDPTFDELYRQNTLYNAARSIPAKKRIIFLLDADEYIPSTLRNSKEWEEIKSLPEGTRIRLPWIQALSGLESYFDSGDPPNPFGYVDDGMDISGGAIHNDRVPAGKKDYFCKELVNIHLGHVPKIRNYKKNSWYMMWEYVSRNTHATILNLNYRKILGESSQAYVKPMQPEWISELLRNKELDITADTVTWWDRQMIDWMKEYGPEHFRKLDIWECDWALVTHKLEQEFTIKNPQRAIDRIATAYLRRSRYRKDRPLNRVFNYALKSLWN